jgi:uncharacterized membrane protein YjdF
MVKIFWFPPSVYITHLIFTYLLDAYTLFPWIDIPMHYLGGLSMAYSLLLVLTELQHQQVIKPLEKIIELLLIFSLVTTAAVFWEFSEFTADQVLGTNGQISLRNTMKDLFMGVMGALSVVGYVSATKSRKKS